jgi:hypothetical protein
VPTPQQHQYVPRHRAAPAPTPPAALAGPGRRADHRHLGDRRRPAQRAVRNTVTLTGLAAAATGVAVATGVVQTPGAAASLADSLSPAASTDHPVAAGEGAGADGVTTDLPSRAAAVSRSEDRTTASRADRRSERDPAKAQALGLSAGPAVGGEKTISASDPQSIAEALLPKFGFSASQMSCLIPLWMGESGWRVNAENASSGAYGIPQALPGSKMATAGAATQIEWGLGYIRDRYGSPCGAWGFKQGHGWY